MGLNIKNERTHALARELAALTGESQTSAVEDALRRRIEEVRSGEEASRSVVEEIMAISADFQYALTPDQYTALRHAGDDLYDDFGLPR